MKRLQMQAYHLHINNKRDEIGKTVKWWNIGLFKYNCDSRCCHMGFIGVNEILNKDIGASNYRASQNKK